VYCPPPTRLGLIDGIEAFKRLMAFVHDAQTDRRWTEQHYVAEGVLVVA
jgi:hypothetical protein